MRAMETGVAIMGRVKMVRRMPRPGKLREKATAATVPSRTGPATPSSVK
jgi:hypothetical protein